jgi:hypothetical protein
MVGRRRRRLGIKGEKGVMTISQIFESVYGAVVAKRNKTSAIGEGEGNG